MAEALYVPKPFEPNAYRVVFASAKDLNNPKLWPLPTGVWRVVFVDFDGNLIPRTEEQNWRFSATKTGFERVWKRNKTATSWKKVKEALAKAWVKRKNLREIVFISLDDDYKDVIAPPSAPKVPTEVPPTAKTPPMQGTPSIVPPAKAPPPPPADAVDSGETMVLDDETDWGPWILFGGLGIAAAVLWMRRGK